MVDRYFAPDLLSGRTILITGASSGIGAACARAAGLYGAKLVLSGRDEARLKAVASELPDAQIIAASLDQPGAAERLAEEAVALAGEIHGLVNNAGFGMLKSNSRFSEDDVDQHFAVNVRAPLLLSTRLSVAMAARGSGSIVNISSVQGSLGTPNQVAYTATKGAVDAMTRALARELGPKGVRVNAIAPGLVATEMWGAALEMEGFMEAAAAHTALRRWATPDMIADAAIFLLSDAARYVAGEVMLVDGGLVRTGNIVPESAFGRKLK